MTTKWDKQTFTECVQPIRVDRGKQVKAREYLSSGKYPVVDQGQSLVAGWTDSEAAVIRDGLPYVVFGDHTRLLKYVDFPFALGADGTKLIKPKDGISPLYFYFYLLVLDIPSRGYSRHYRLLKEKEISLPPLPEQKKIAAVLLKIHRAIETQEKIIQSARDLKKSTMQHLFTRGLRGEKTKMTEIGEIPESWEVVSIQDRYEVTKKPKALILSHFKTIAHVPMEDIPQGPPILNQFRMNSHDQIRSGTYFEEGNLLLSKITPCFENGKQAIAFEVPNGFGIATTEAIPIKARGNTKDTHYLHYYLSYPNVRALMAQKMEGATGRQRLPVHLVKNWFIPLPTDNKEMNAVSDILLRMDNKIQLHESNKSALQNLFKTTLNKLMTGEVRVKNLDIDTSYVLGNENKG